MSVSYSLVQRPKPGDPSAPKKFYAVAVKSGEASLRELANQIAEISTVSSIDTLAVLESFLKVIPDHLLNGRIVRLGDFGSFRLTIESNGSETAEAFSSADIRGVKVRFNPGKMIKSLLKTASFQRA